MNIADLIHGEPTGTYLSGIPRSYHPGNCPGKWAAVFNFTSSLVPSGNPGFPVIWFPMQDVEDLEAMASREEIELILESCHAWTQRGDTLWHCRAGINRSAFMLGLYLTRFRGLSVDETIHLLRTKRKAFHPWDRTPETILGNSLFEKKLREWRE